jgi:hypothetical protein
MARAQRALCTQRAWCALGSSRYHLIPTAPLILQLLQNEDPATRVVATYRHLLNQRMPISKRALVASTSPAARHGCGTRSMLVRERVIETVRAQWEAPPIWCEVRHNFEPADRTSPAAQHPHSAPGRQHKHVLCLVVVQSQRPRRNEVQIAAGEPAPRERHTACTVVLGTRAWCGEHKMIASSPPIRHTSAIFRVKKTNM